MIVKVGCNDILGQKPIDGDHFQLDQHRSSNRETFPSFSKSSQSAAMAINMYITRKRQRKFVSTLARHFLFLVINDKFKILKKFRKHSLVHCKVIILNQIASNESKKKQHLFC